MMAGLRQAVCPQEAISCGQVPQQLQQQQQQQPSAKAVSTTIVRPRIDAMNPIAKNARRFIVLHSLASR